MKTTVTVFVCAAAAAFTTIGQSRVDASILYSENWESRSASSQTAGPSGFVQVSNIGSYFQVQGGGGGGGVTLTAGIDNNGVGGSQALFANWDQSAATSFTFNQYTAYGAVGAPGAGASPNQISVDMDLLMSGSETSNSPIDILLQNNGTDISYTPTLANGQYTHVHYTLDQATGSGSYDPTQASNFRLQHGAGGFGFDANNIVRVDNILIQTVPEPAGLVLFGLSIPAVLAMRRRKALATACTPLAPL